MLPAPRPPAPPPSSRGMGWGPTLSHGMGMQGTTGRGLAQVIVTLAMPFLVFYLAETAFAPDMQMSGVLSVVCFGLVFASPYGKVRVDPRVQHFLHEFWGNNYEKRAC